MIAWNYYVGALGINGVTIGESSDKYFNLFTPASYAFSIWGIIFLGLLLYSIYLISIAFKSKHRNLRVIIKSTPYIIIANILNSLWSYLFISGYITFSLIVMFMILFFLSIVVMNLDIGHQEADMPTTLLIRWPISFYIGWITVATIANNSAYLSVAGFYSVEFDDYSWTIIVVVLATVVNLLMIKYRNMREFGLVGIWALVAISLRHWGSDFIDISILALFCSAIIFITILVHAYRNREKEPILKLIMKLLSL